MISEKLNPKLLPYWQLMRADKPIGNYLLLWPTLWGLWVAAEGVPPIGILLVFIAGVYLMRAAGCVINDFADRKVDGKVKRTAARPLVTGLVTEKQALSLFAGLLLIAFLLVLTLNTYTILMSFVAVALASLYPFMKRITYLPQFVLGAAFSWSIVMAFTAIQGALPWWVWGLYVANLVWTVAYDTMYAMVDRDDDIKIGVKSTALLFGRFDKLIIAILQLVMLVLLLILAMWLSWSWPVYIALIVVFGLFVYQQWMIRERAREACFQAFLHNNYVGLTVFLGIALQYAVI